MQIHVDLLLIRLVGSSGMSGLQAQRIQHKVSLPLSILLSNKPNLYSPGKDAVSPLVIVSFSQFD